MSFKFYYVELSGKKKRLSVTYRKSVVFSVYSDKSSSLESFVNVFHYIFL